MEISELQKDLAAAFRWTARLNMNEGIANHYCFIDKFLILLTNSAFIFLGPLSKRLL